MVQKRHDRHLNNLFKLAQDMPVVGNARVTACLVFKNRIVSYGFAQNKSHPLQAQFCRNEDSIWLHAEVDAIRNALRKYDRDFLSSCSLYVARAKQVSNPQTSGIVKWSKGLAKPCEGCQSAIDHFCISSVYYTKD